MFVSTQLAPPANGHALHALWNSAGQWRPQVVLAASDGELRRSMIAVLARAGFVVSATNDVGILGALAWRHWAAAGTAPEVVLVEWLPSGATLAALREAGTALRGSAVVVLAPTPDDAVRAAAEAAGAVTCVFGPFDPQALCDVAFDLVA